MILKNYLSASNRGTKDPDRFARQRLGFLSGKDDTETDAWELEKRRLTKRFLPLFWKSGKDLVNIRSVWKDSEADYNIQGPSNSGTGTSSNNPITKRTRAQ